jgi:hypothetical protein
MNQNIIDLSRKLQGFELTNIIGRQPAEQWAVRGCKEAPDPIKQPQGIDYVCFGANPEDVIAKAMVENP